MTSADIAWLIVSSALVIITAIICATYHWS
jgi:hypothetical protein